MKRLVLALIAVLLMGATTPNSFVTPQTPNRGFFQFLSTNAADTYVTIYTAGANGSRCVSGLATSADAAAHNIIWRIVNNTGAGFQVAVKLPAYAGTAGIPSQPLMNPSITTGLPVDQYGNQYIQLISGDTIQATYETQLTTSALWIMFVCSDY